MEELIVIQGTELKLHMTISGIEDTNGVEESIENINLQVWMFTQSKDKIQLTEDQIIINKEDNSCLLLIDTSELTPGILNIEIEVNIPDDDFLTDGDDPSGYRREIYRKTTNIKVVK